MVKRPKSKKINAIPLELAPAERTILLELFTLDEELDERLSGEKNIAALSLTLEEWEIVAEGVAAEANHTTNKKRREILESLSAKVEDLLEEFFPDKQTDREPQVIDLTNFGASGLEMEDGALEYLNYFAENILDICSDAGVSPEELLKSFVPTRVEPQEKIKVRLKGRQREMLLKLPETPETIKSIIQAASPRKQTVAMTLSQVHELENTVANAVHQCSDRKLKRALQIIDSTLIDVQVHYTDGNDTAPSALKLALQPNSLSRGAYVRKLLTDMLQAHRLDSKNK